MKNQLIQIIATLKTLDVRGFESMDRLVGCVMLLTEIINNLPTEEADSSNG